MLGDLQIPFHNAEWINRVKSLALEWQIRSLVLGGDVVDFHSLAQFIGKGEDAESELDDAESYLVELVSGFDKTTWLMGNHEERLRKRLAKWLSSKRVVRLFGLEGKVEASDYFWCLVGDDWLIAHPRNISEIPGRVPMWLAEKYQRNVAAFHAHTIGTMQSRDHLWAIDVGMCADEARLEYVAIRLNKRPRMSNGALILRWDGKRYWAHHLTKHTDFAVLHEWGKQWQKSPTASHSREPLPMRKPKPRSSRERG